MVDALAVGAGRAERGETAANAVGPAGLTYQTGQGPPESPTVHVHPLPAGLLVQGVQGHGIVHRVFGVGGLAVVGGQATQQVARDLQIALQCV